MEIKPLIWGIIKLVYIVFKFGCKKSRAVNELRVAKYWGAQTHSVVRALTS